MIAPADALLAQFETAATAAQAAEAELRKSLALEIAKAERQRAYAFRRARFIRALAIHVPAEAQPEDAWRLQKRAVCEELGWGALSKSYEEILTQMEPLGAAVRSCIAQPADEATAAMMRELNSFEAWFEETRGKPFYVLFDLYVPEVPVVDF